MEKLNLKNKWTLSIDNSWLLTFVLFIASFLLVAFWKDTNNLVPLGIVLILMSLVTIYRCKEVPPLLLLFAIIGYINLSSAVLDYFYIGTFSNNYQRSLRLSLSGLQYAKMFVLNYSILSIMITPRFISQAKYKIDFKIEQRKDNPLIAYSFAAVSFLLTVTQFAGSAGQTGYISNSNALFEYVILFLTIGIYYSGDRKVLKYIYIMVGALYILIGLLGGDRSSAFMAVLIYILFYFNKKIKINRLIMYSFIGIISSNVIGLIRDRLTNFSDLIHMLLNRSLLFFFSDTVSASFYSGITIIEYGRVSSDNISVLFKWIKALLLGVNDETNIVRLAGRVNYNGGGGMYPAYFGYFAGYLGVIIGAIILGVVIRVVFTGETTWKRITQIVIIALVFRWYLYTPVSLFRTIVVNFNILFLVTKVIADNMNNKSRV